MTILTIPLRCMRAKLLRTLMLFGVFTLGVASMTALNGISSVIGESFEKKLASFGANIMVAPKKESVSVSYGGFSLGDVALEGKSIPLTQSIEAIDKIDFRANIAVVAPKLLGMITIEGPTGKMNIPTVGVIWNDELALKGFWEVKGNMPSSENEILAGYLAAQRLGLEPGTTAMLAGKPVRLAGYLAPTGSDDDNVVFAEISVIQSITGKTGQADFLEVAALCAGCPISDIVSQLETALPGLEVRALQQVVRQRMYSVHMAQNMAMLVSLVILVTACAMVVMSMLSAVSERRREIGIMRSVGFSRPRVFIIFAFEALLEGAAAGAAGFVAGHLLARQVLIGLDFSDAAMLAFSSSGFAATIVGVSALAVASAAFPAFKAAMVEPAEALSSL